MRFSQQGIARTRQGYFSTDIDLGEAGYEAIPKDIVRHNATFFAINKKVKYYNWSTSTIYDTGISLTADLTCIDEFKGDLFGINTTDGLQYLNISRLTQAASSGAGVIYIEVDAVARLASIGGLTTGTIRIENTNYAYSSIDVPTGEITLSGTLSSNYDAGAITTVKTNYPLVPKGSKLVFWANSMNIIGAVDDINDTASYTLFFSKFAVATNHADIVTFPGTNVESVNTRLLDIVATKDYLYLFTDSETYYIARSDIDITTGARIPQIFSKQYGVANSNSVTILDNSIVWLSQNKRIIHGQVRIEQGSITIDIAEQFDSPIKEDLQLADDDQSGARAYSLTKSKEIHIKLSIAGVTKEYIYDSNIKEWCPPDTNKYFVGVFERFGEPYALAEDDDTIYQLNVGYSDDGAEIETIIAFGEFEGQDSRTTFDIKDIQVSGNIIFGTEIQYTPRMNYADGSTNMITFPAGITPDVEAISLDPISLFVIGGSGTIETERDFDTSISNYPAIVRSFQPIFKSVGSDTGFGIQSWSLQRKEYNSFIVTTI